MPEIKKIVTLITFDNYTAVIKNSIGSRSFRNLYAVVDGARTDIVKDGELSCAYFVSSILFLFKLTKEVHATVSGTVKDLEDSGWVEIEKLKEGAVLVWAEINFGDNDFHRHIGFYMGENRAVSNDYKKGFPVEHPWKFDGKRKTEKIYWNQILDRG